MWLPFCAVEPWARQPDCYVCMYVCMIVCLYVVAILCRWAVSSSTWLLCMYTRMCVYMWSFHVIGCDLAQLVARVYVCLCVYVRSSCVTDINLIVMYVCTFVCMYVASFFNPAASLSTWLHACMHACVYVSTYVQRISQPLSRPWGPHSRACIYVCMHVFYVSLS